MHGHKWLQTLPYPASVLPFCVVHGYIPGSLKTPVNRMNEVAKKIHFVNAWQLCGRILIIFMFYWMSCVYWLNWQYSYLIGTMGIQRCIPKWWQMWGVVWAQHCNWGDLFWVKPTAISFPVYLTCYNMANITGRQHDCTCLLSTIWMLFSCASIFISSYQAHFK